MSTPARPRRRRLRRRPERLARARAPGRGRRRRRQLAGRRARRRARRRRLAAGGLGPARPAEPAPAGPRPAPPVRTGDSPTPRPTAGGCPSESRSCSRQGDLVGAQGWAMQRGWTISDGTAPEDAALRDADRARAGPARARRHRPGGVLRGRAARWTWSPSTSSTRGPARGAEVRGHRRAGARAPSPALRLSPARIWRHGTGGLVQVPSRDPAFDRRWLLLAAEDGPQVRRLVAGPGRAAAAARQRRRRRVLAGRRHLAAIRPDGHRPQLIEHHARLLAALVGALAAGY